MIERHQFPPAGNQAIARLVSKNGSITYGTVMFTQRGDKVALLAQVFNLAGGPHSLYIHETGNCSSPNAASAGPVWNAKGAPPGARRSGELPNIVVRHEDNATLEAQVTGLSVGTGAANDVIGPFGRRSWQARSRSQARIRRAQRLARLRRHRDDSRPLPASTSGGCRDRRINRQGSTMGFLAGKKILITGVLSNRSIAYGIAHACQREGATLAFTYVNDDLKDRVVKLAADFGSVAGAAAAT